MENHIKKFLNIFPNLTEILIKGNGQSAVKIANTLRQTGKHNINKSDIETTLGIELFKETTVHEGGIHLCGKRMRYSIVKCAEGYNLSLRVYVLGIPDPEDILLPKRLVKNFTNLESGLVIVSGPVGAGKSTTIASLVAHRAQSRCEHVVTLEDPIEFIYPQNEEAFFTQRELGRDFETYAGGFRDTLRQTPDLIVVQELRDPDTIEIAISAALAGKLVVGTLHTSEAALIPRRMMSYFEGNALKESIAQSFRMGIHQRLITNPRKEDRVVPVHEVIIVNDAIRNQIRKDNVSAIRQAMEMGIKDGMATYEKAYEDRVRQGLLPNWPS